MKNKIIIIQAITKGQMKSNRTIYQTLFMLVVISCLHCSGCYSIERAILKQHMSEEELALARRFDEAHVKYTVLQVFKNGRCNLDLRQNSRFDLSILQGLAIDYLVLYKTQVVDLFPLQGMDISKLSLAFTEVQDLSPLRGMPLQSLSIAYTDVQDLSPLQGMPLFALWMQSTKVTDLKPLQGIPLTYLFLNHRFSRM